MKVRIYWVSGKGRGAYLPGVESVWEVAVNDGCSQAGWCRALSNYLESLNSCVGSREPWEVWEHRHYMLNSRVM